VRKETCCRTGCKNEVEVPDDFKYEFCCNGRECGCYGYAINPVFCDDCEDEARYEVQLRKERQ
jgi:hypothetical protein